MNKILKAQITAGGWVSGKAIVDGISSPDISYAEALIIATVTCPEKVTSKLVGAVSLSYIAS